MRRLLVTLSIATLTATLLIPGAALGAKPVGSCPATASGWALVDQAEWWARTVDGFEAEGITVYDGSGNFTEDFEEASRALGFASAQALYDYVWGAQWDAMNKNGDDFVCMKDLPRTPGNPAYIFGGVDNTASPAVR
jgi:hypothetical protein